MTKINNFNCGSGKWIAKKNVKTDEVKDLNQKIENSVELRMVAHHVTI